MCKAYHMTLEERKEAILNRHIYDMIKKDWDPSLAYKIQVLGQQAVRYRESLIRAVDYLNYERKLVAELANFQYQKLNGPRCNTNPFDARPFVVTSHVNSRGLFFEPSQEHTHLWPSSKFYGRRSDWMRDSMGKSTSAEDISLVTSITSEPRDGPGIMIDSRLGQCDLLDTEEYRSLNKERSMDVFAEDRMLLPLQVSFPGFRPPKPSQSKQDNPWCAEWRKRPVQISEPCLNRGKKMEDYAHKGQAHLWDFDRHGPKLDLPEVNESWFWPW